jgi:hypothetical protein
MSSTVTIDGQECVIVPDGPLDQDAYDKAPVKVVHILKEATKSDGLAGKLLENIRKDGTVKWRIWKVTARRSYALQNGLRPWDSLSPEAFGQAFRASAVLNLNDTIPCGKEDRFTSDTEGVARFAGLRWPDTREKITQLRPSVVVCGGTYELATRLFRDRGEAVQDQGDFFVWEGIPFIKAFHPSFWGRRHSDEYEEFRQRSLKAMPLFAR